MYYPEAQSIHPGPTEVASEAESSHRKVGKRKAGQHIDLLRGFIHSLKMFNCT